MDVENAIRNFPNLIKNLPINGTSLVKRKGYPGRTKTFILIKYVGQLESFDIVPLTECKRN